ncbi:MAG TPA: hypothetical protein VN622_03350 [Clostridia bacterium]|nr:hypothetical protein [Clostridia bacterium]
MSRRNRTAVLCLVSVAIILTASVVGWRHLRPATLSQTELWLSHPETNTVLTDTDYQVLSSFLKGGQTSIRIGSSRGSSVLAPTTALFFEPIPIEDQNWMKRELKGLQDDTIAAFHGCMSHLAVVAPRFAVSEPYHIGTFEEVESIEKLYAHYPQTNGFVRFSCVAYSRNEPQALFWIERRMSPSAVGMFVLMEKNASGEWVQAGEMVRWIA